MKIEKLSKYTLEELVVIFRDIFPSEEDQSSIEECFRSSLNGGPVEGVKELEYFITRKDSKIVGAIGLYSTPEDFREVLWIGWYGVHPPHRNKGIGTNLLKFSIREAKKRGDILIVAVNDDDSVKRLKGKARPIFPLMERLEILEAIECIDFLVSFSEDTPRRVISELLPDVLVKGGDWSTDRVVGRKEVEDEGGEVVIVPYLEGRSSSELLRRILESSQHKTRR